MTELAEMQPVALTEGEREELLQVSQDLRFRMVLRITLLLSLLFLGFFVSVPIVRLLILGLFFLECGALTHAYRRHREIQAYLENRVIPIWHDTAGRLLLLKPRDGKTTWSILAPRGEHWWSFSRFFPKQGRGNTALSATSKILRKIKP